MKRIFLSFAVAAAMMFGASGVMAQNQQPKDCNGKGHCQEMKLSDDQMKKIKEIRDNESAKTLQLDLQIKEKKAHLNTLRVADKADMGAINATVEEIGKLKIEREKIHEASIQEIRKNLTPQQRLAMDRWGYKKFGKHGQQHGNGHGHQHNGNHKQGGHDNSHGQQHGNHDGHHGNHQQGGHHGNAQHKGNNKDNK